MSEYNLMKILILLSIFISSSIVSADIDFDQKLDFIVAKQFSEDTKAEIVEITYIALRDMDIDISSVDNFEEFLDPFLDEYFTEIKLDIRELYLDKFTEEELSAYYDFISKESGLSFLAKQIEISSDVLEISFKNTNRMINRLNNRLIRDYPELFEDLY